MGIILYDICTLGELEDFSIKGFEEMYSGQEWRVLINIKML